MSEVERYCEQCSRITLHKSTPFFIPSAKPLADRVVDLTGRDESPSPGANPLPSSTEYQCTICGHVSVDIGDLQPQKMGEDVFVKLQRGNDFQLP